MKPPMLKVAAATHVSALLFMLRDNIPYIHHK